MSDRIGMTSKSKAMEREAMTETAVLPRWCCDSEAWHVEVWPCWQRPGVLVPTTDGEMKEGGPPSLVEHWRSEHSTSETVALSSSWRSFFSVFCIVRIWYFRLFGDIGLGTAGICIRRRRWLFNYLQWWLWHRGPRHISRFVYIGDETAYVNVFIFAVSCFRQFGWLGHIATKRIIGERSATRPVTDLRSPWLTAGNTERLARWRWAGI